MALSDCTHCWSTPCDCGWDYKNMSTESMTKFISNILQYRTKEEALTILSLAKNEVRMKKNWNEEIEL